MRPGLYRYATRLAGFRHLAWMLVLALLAGLAAPAFASWPDVGSGGALAPGAHVHSDGTIHVHAKPPAPDAAQASRPGVRPTKAQPHCPGCLTAAECAIACLGVGLLPAPVPVPAAAPLAGAWFVSAKPSPAGAAPAGDLDPPRPVPVR